MTTTSRLRRGAVALFATLLTVAGTALPATADPGNGSLQATGEAQMQQLADRYASLGGALIDMYAKQKGVTATQFMAQNPQTTGALLGVDPTQLPAIPASPAPAATPAMPAPSSSPAGDDALAQLQRRLGGAGLTLPSGHYDSLEAYAQQLSQRSAGVDAAVVSAGAAWAKQMGTLRVPTLTTPDTPQVDTSQATSVPKEGLMFGLFLDKSLTALVADSPDVFAQVKKSGVGTPAAMQAWREALQKARVGSQADFTSMMPSPCGAALLSGMSTGDAEQASKLTGSGCSPCLTTGVYLNAQMMRLFDPSAQSSLPNSQDNVINPSEWNKLQDWQKQQILQQNPALRESLAKSMTGTSAVPSSCNSGSAAASGALTTTLPGVFGNLQR